MAASSSGLKLDDEFDPDDVATWPVEGMALARRFGTLCYRSRSEFDTRFSWEAPADAASASESTNPSSTQFEVERYLDHQADKFQGAYDPNCYMVLSEAMDRMDLR